MPVRKPLSEPSVKVDRTVMEQEVDAKIAERNEKIVVTLKVITPILGGGHEEGATPEEVEIRPSSIKGHLRFWWRATTGEQDLASLLKRERKYFGGASNDDEGEPSAIQIHTEVLNKGKFIAGVHPQKYDGPPGAFANFKDVGPKYALWTLQQPREERGKSEHLGQSMPTKGMKEEVSFKLSISFPKELKIYDEIARALKAWVLFGGYGARTRRGLGSLAVESVESPQTLDLIPSIENIDSIENGIKNLLGKLKNSGTDALPRLGGSKLYLGKPVDSPKDAWETVIDLFQDFRQGENVGRNHASDPQNRFKLGRSHWPEPDSLREVRQSFSRIDWKRHAPIHPARIFFPRADFGLPIQFSFIGFPDKLANAKLTYPDTDRLASRLILKAMAVEINGERKYVPIALNLNVSHIWDLPGKVKLKFDDKDQRTNRPYEYTLTESDMDNPASSSNVNLMTSHNGQTASEAFCHYFKKTTNNTNNEEGVSL